MDAAVRTIIARDDHAQPIGFIAVADTGGESLIVDWLVVAEESRGVGLGRILLGMSTRTTEDDSKAQKLRTTTPAIHATAVSMLHDAGWTPETGATTFVNGHPHISWCWE